ncbi:hypothetical protein C8J56DRAFT_535969 [Mycena floridula]|nr:hypothetical protein C8J56DRAFT_535969 [Mycena floridula]
MSNRPSLKDINKDFARFMQDLDPSTTPTYIERLRRNVRRPTTVQHRCPGYRRQEMALATSVSRTAIISHFTPSIQEICQVCNQEVEEGTFRCPCGQADDGVAPTVRCHRCSDWSHLGCHLVVNDAQQFTCSKCLYLAIPLSPLAPTEIHPLLATQAFDWCLLFSPPSPQTIVHHLSDPATSPPLPSLEIISAFLPWRLRILPQRQSYLTIGDVLSGIHYSLNLLVTKAEFDHESTDANRLITEAFVARCKLLDPQVQQREKSKGLKRVDFLQKNVSFLGLSPSSQGPSTLRLLVSSYPALNNMP